MINLAKQIPKWVAEEISDAKLEEFKKLDRTGYILDINKKAKTVDFQFYENLPDDRHIATLELDKSIKLADLKHGEDYQVSLTIYKAALSNKLKEFLQKEYSTTLEDIYKFNLSSVELMKQ